jgi:hypothetical protein
MAGMAGRTPSSWSDDVNRILAVLAFAAVVLAGCSGGSKLAPATGAPPTDTGTATAVQPAASPSEDVTRTVEAAARIDWTHRLAVYTARLGVEQGPNRVFPKRAVVTWDLDAGKLAASFEYNPADEYPVGVALAGRDVVFATEARVVRAHLDGSDQQVLLKAGDGNAIQDIRVAPGGQMLAVVVSPNDIGRPGTLRILDLQSGAERFHIDQSDARFDGMRGHFWQVQWRDDESGVIVSMATHSEMYGSRATLFLDGRVRAEDIQGYGNLSPTGRMWAGDIGQMECMFVGSHEFVIRDLDSGRVPVRLSDAANVYMPLEWAPDGSQFVFLKQTGRTCLDLSAEKQVAYVVSMSGDAFEAPVRVSDLTALRREWYGDGLFSTDCDDGKEPRIDRWGDPRLYCIDSDAIRTLTVGGRNAGTAVAPEPVRVIEPGAAR